MRSLLLVLTLVCLSVPTPTEAAVRVSTRQGFDKCFVPTIRQMKRWWDNSPYWNVNVYIGGSSRACAQSNLTPNWVASVHQQGWNFIPTWVGPQAPCTNYASRISWSTATARQQGIAEADKAIAAAAALGFTNPMIIYYDMEGYPDNTSCYNAVNAFFDGWGARMRARNHRAGGYGSACASGMRAWGDITNWPHSVWMAHWVYASYRRNANVWNVACIPNFYWQDHQRIRQYAGDHNETWGGVTFTIDSNALDGIVQGSNDHPTALATPPSGIHDVVDTAPATTDVEPAGLRSELVPRFATLPAGDIQAARGSWLVTTEPPVDGRVRLALHATNNRGTSWRTTTIHDFRLGDGNLIAGPVWIDTVDAQTGYVAVRLASSANFSRGMLFRTSDGGQTWEERALPLGERVKFVTAQVGFTAGGPAGDELHVTRDGGQTWSLVDIAEGETTFVDVPTFWSEREGVLPVTVASETRPRVQLYTTTDQGATWNLAHAVPLADEPGTFAPVAIADAQTWIVVDPANDSVHVTGPSGAVTPATTQWPTGIVEMEFANVNEGTVHTAIGTCTGSKQDGTFACEQARRIWRTTDGGKTWDDEAPTDDELDEPSQSGGCTAGGGAASGLALLGVGYGVLALGMRLRRARRRRRA